MKRNKALSPKLRTDSLKFKAQAATAHWNFKKIATFFALAGILIGLVSGWYAYFNLYMTTERRFWAAIDNSMSTPSTVRTLTEGASGNLVEQSYRFYYGQERVFENKVSFSERNATSNTFVETQGIVYYPQDQYLRYTAFKNETADNTDKSIDEFLGVWASQNSGDDEEARLNYQSELVTLAIFGNFDPVFRNEVIREMQEKNVYRDVNQALEDVVDGEKVLRYSTTVQLKPYVELLNRAFERAGYAAFPPLNPDNYEEDSTVPATVTVRTKDNSIIGISFGGRDEVYSNYGVVNNVERPDTNLSVTELQQQVQAKIEN